MSPLARGLATVLLLAAAQAGAQALGGPYLSAEIRGQVVDADTTQPVEGAVAVARWEWLDYTPPGFHSSGGYSNAGRAVHVAESVADARGRIDFPRWGPKARAGGRMDDNAPIVLVFKAGYQPLVRNKYKAGEPLRLHRFEGPTADYVKSLFDFEERGLHWRFTEDWPAFPRMVLALHREKARLGEDGRKIPGANSMQGRSGAGQLVDAADGKPLPVNGALKITWTLRRSDGTAGSRTLVQTKNTGSLQRAAEFFVSPWRLPSPAPAGWEIDPAVRPVVRAYVAGYAGSDEVKWTEAGGTLALRRRPEGRDAYVAAIREIRSEVDAALARGDREEVMKQYRFLLYQQRYLCDAITPDLRQGACYEESSDVYRYVADARRVEKYAPEDGEITVRVIESGSQAKAATAAAPGAPEAVRQPPPAKNVGGFSIETR
ncbi:MAG: hypothetical protein ACXWG8_06970 [Usitatibacter sp.]